VFGNKAAIVTRFEGANAIVIAAPMDVQRQLGEVIRQLDQRRPQVLVEAIIVEISDTAAKQLGVPAPARRDERQQHSLRGHQLFERLAEHATYRGRDRRGGACAPTPQPSTARW
jgi:Flp pilus assembly secretin CpaC